MKPFADLVQKNVEQKYSEFPLGSQKQIEDYIPIVENIYQKYSDNNNDVL